MATQMELGPHERSRDTCEAERRSVEQPRGKRVRCYGLTGPEAVLEPEVAVPLDDREYEHVPVAADQLQRRQRSQHGAVRQQSCR